MKGPKVITKTMYVHLSKWAKDECEIYPFKSEGDPILGEVEVTFMMPDKDPVVAQVEALELQLKKHEAEAYDKSQAIKDKIQSLLAIGHVAAELDADYPF